jgi:hypothetical protein
MQAIDLVTGVAEELDDVSYVTWSKAELTNYLNSAQRQVALVRPDASSEISNLTLVAGTKQSLPSTARRLLDITRNMGSDGSTPGKPVRAIEEVSLDLYRPGWHSETGKTAIKNFAYKEETPRDFYVYPPVHATTTVIVEARLAVNPAEITDVDNDAISLDDVYEGPLRNWMMHLAYSKETDSIESRTLAARHEQSFYNSLGIKTKVDVGFSPSIELKKEVGG